MSNPPLQQDPGVALAEAGRVEEAMSHWRNVLARDPRDVRSHHNLGIALAQRGEAEAAEESLRQAILYQPRHVALAECPCP